MATDVDIKQLLEAGAHFGHKTSRWHPKMAPYIHSKRGGTHIIDLTKTVEGLETALDFLSQTASAGKQVLMVGTKRQAQDIVKKLAEDTKMPFVTERWLGGMITNWNTIGGRVKHLQDLENRMASGELANKYKKVIRDDGGQLSTEKREDLIDELGDVIWYVAALADDLGITLAEVAKRNYNKLKSRRERGKLKGSGDNR